MKSLLMIIGLLSGIQVFSQSTDSSKSEPVFKKNRQLFRLAKTMIAPAALIITGLTTIDDDHFISRYQIRAERNEDLPFFKTHVDDYMQYAPAVTVYLLSALGVKSKNNWQNRTALLVKSELLMTSIVTPLKMVTSQMRPDSSNFHSFPSGHTAEAFAAATFLHKEFGGRSIWYSIGGYTLATGVGALRILNNKHWLSDVLVGAGIGIFSTNIVYFTHRYKWGKHGATVTVVPTYRKGPGFNFVYKFG